MKGPRGKLSLFEPIFKEFEKLKLKLKNIYFMLNCWWVTPLERGMPLV
jgi:hypothetical protein